MITQIIDLKTIQFLECQSGVKVIAMASTLIALLVKNLVAKKNSWELNSSPKQQPGPSLSERVR